MGPADHRDGRVPALLPADAAGQQGVAIDGIADAAPPTPDTSSGPVPGVPGLPGLLDDVIGKLPLGDLGSNAVALGRTATASGNGLLLGNPHFPWDGPERFYEASSRSPARST